MRADSVFIQSTPYNILGDKNMNFIVDMAKAHLQNVALRIEELKTQQKNIGEEIDKLTAYLNSGVENIERHSQDLLKQGKEE